MDFICAPIFNLKNLVTLIQSNLQSKHKLPESIGYDQNIYFHFNFKIKHVKVCLYPVIQDISRSLFCFLKPVTQTLTLSLWLRESVSQRREDSSQQMFSCLVVNMKTLATTTEIREGMELSAKSHDSPTGFAHPCASRPQRVPVKNSDHKLTVATGFHVGYVPSLLLIWKIISWQLWIWNIVAFTHNVCFCFVLFSFFTLRKNAGIPRRNVRFTGLSGGRNTKAQVNKSPVFWTECYRQLYKIYEQAHKS